MSIMIEGSQSSLLSTLQKDLVNTLSSYNSYYGPESATWEKNFQPHVTIARDLTPELLNQARSELRQAKLPSGSIKEVTLVIVNNFGLEEACLPENLTCYKL